MLTDFFKRDLGGIYFSSKGISVAQQSGGKLKTVFVQIYPEETGQRSVLSDDIFEVFKNKDDELLAFMQKVLRDSHLDTKNVVVTLPPKNLIIRFFEMPNIPRSEIEAGINFEMKKYIPFKIEELQYDFQYRVRQKVGIVEVILCGIRQNPLDQYEHLMQQLHLNVIAFEPGVFSLFRLLVMQGKISHRLSSIILEFDHEEANIVITEKGFPYFTRDIKLDFGSQAPDQKQNFEAILSRLINEVRVSMDYYRRQFLKKDMDVMIMISHSRHQEWAEQFHKELGVKTVFVSVEDLLNVKDINEKMFSNLSKAVGAAQRVDRPQLITLNLKKKVAVKPGLALSGVAGKNFEKVIMDLFNDSKTALVQGGIAALVIMLLAYGIGFSKVFTIEKELAASAVEQFPLLPGIDVSSLGGIKASRDTFKAKADDFKELVEGRDIFYTKLSILPRLLVPGIWIKYLAFNSDAHRMELKGGSYAAIEKESSDNMISFISNLKECDEFKNSYSVIELTAYSETTDGEDQILTFHIQGVTKGKEVSTTGAMSTFF